VGRSRRAVRAQSRLDFDSDSDSDSERSSKKARISSGSRVQLHIHEVADMALAGRTDLVSHRTASGNCDPAVTRRLPSKSEIIGFVFRNWSGARGGRGPGI
jgi:hypothetical protein